MKKTTLLLLTTCALAGCYTAPEMTENKYRDFYSDTSICGTETMYQNKNLRACIDQRLAEEDKNKKTVSILPLPSGDVLVVPKTNDDAQLKDVNRVYEIVDIRQDNSVVIEKGANDDVQDNEEPLVDVTSDMSLDELPQGNQKVEIKALVDENTSAHTEAETDVDVLDGAEENNNLEETVVEQVTERSVSENGADGLTLVVGPLKEDLVIEVKSAGEKTKTVETKTTKTKTMQTPAEKVVDIEQARRERIEEARKKAEERRKSQKKQKEVLPLEEK